MPEETLECGTCKACCTGEIWILTPEDDPGKYLTEEINGITSLRHKPNGDCVYLSKSGCMIYEDRPRVCRAFHCGKFYDFIMAKNSKELKEFKENGFDFNSEVMKAGYAHSLLR